MAAAVQFPGVNMLLRAPDGAENVGDMHTFHQRALLGFLIGRYTYPERMLKGADLR